MNALSGLDKAGPASGFTREEREEIITRLQVMENVCSAVSAQLSDLIAELFPQSAPTEAEPYGHRVNMVREVHEFATKLAAMLDAMAANPMFAAMLPADMVEG